MVWGPWTGTGYPGALDGHLGMPGLIECCWQPAGSGLVLGVCRRDLRHDDQLKTKICVLLPAWLFATSDVPLAPDAFLMSQRLLPLQVEEAELLFLVWQWLKNKGCQQSAQQLEAEADKLSLLPLRTDVYGEPRWLR